MSDVGPIRARFFRLLCRHQWLCSERAYYWLLDRFADNNGWRPLSTRHSEREQAR